MGGSEGGFLWRPMLSAHLWRLRYFLPFAMSIGTFVWAGRTAAAAAARHVTNLLPAAIHRNNRKNKRSALSRGARFLLCANEHRDIIYEGTLKITRHVCGYHSPDCVFQIRCAISASTGSSISGPMMRASMVRGRSGNAAAAIASASGELRARVVK